MSTEIVLWMPSFGGKYGFVKLAAPDQILENIQPLSEEEELRQLLKQYALDDHRLYPGTPQISFQDYVKVWKESTQRSRTTIRRDK